MKTEQEQRQAIRQILFDANDICQATPCENEYCIYHGDYRCYDNIIVDKLIEAGYGDLSEYKAEIERLKEDYAKLQEQFAQYQMASDKEIRAQVKQAKIDVLNELKEKCKFDGHIVGVYKNDIEEMIEGLKK